MTCKAVTVLHAAKLVGSCKSSKQVGTKILEVFKQADKEAEAIGVPSPGPNPPVRELTKLVSKIKPCLLSHGFISAEGAITPTGHSFLSEAFAAAGFESQNNN